MGKNAVSIVVPVLNEAPWIDAALRPLRAGLTDNVDLIVVDGGSADDTRGRAARYARVLTSPAGRARQLNCGAAAARGDVLLFLHVDALLPSGWQEAIEVAMTRPRVVGGGFLIQADPRSPSLDMITALSNVRSRLRRRFYGDQAIFVRNEVFRRVGGFDESLGLFEGYDLTRRLQRVGEVACVPRYVRASSRRFLGRGIWRTFFTFHVLKMRYLLGALPADTERYYPAPAPRDSHTDQRQAVSACPTGVRAGP